MVTKADVTMKDQADVAERPAPVELTPEQVNAVSGGCLYSPGFYGPTLILPVLVAILIG